jgi:Glucodextranase, domain N
MASKVWYSVADGVLSDTFSPTIENSNVSTVQYIVTDGRSFADLTFGPYQGRGRAGRLAVEEADRCRGRVRAVGHGRDVRVLPDLFGLQADPPGHLAHDERYVADGTPTVLPVTISSPANGAPVTGSTMLSGTTVPGAEVSVSSAQPGSSTGSTTVVDTAAPNGHFSVIVPTPPGSDTITVAVSTGSHSSGWAQETVTGS